MHIHIYKCIYINICVKYLDAFCTRILQGLCPGQVCHTFFREGGHQKRSVSSHNSCLRYPARGGNRTTTGILISMSSFFQILSIDMSFKFSAVIIWIFAQYLYIIYTQSLSFCTIFNVFVKIIENVMCLFNFLFFACCYIMFISLPFMLIV